MEITPAQWWMEGGWSMYPVMLVGIFGIIGAAGSVMVREQRIAGIALLLTVGAGLLGGAGMMMNRRVVDEAIAAVDPSQQAMIREVGYRESMRPAQLGGGLLAVGFPLALVGLLLARRREPS